jgi:mRNA-degrading endonuclease RelE of RelBE toxin-antitoxin system
MALIILPRAAAQMAAMPRADAKRLQRIAGNPSVPHAGVRPLVGLPGLFRVRQGDWRAVYAVEDGDVVVDRVAHRREVYR